jgi:CD63 antigen
MASAGMTVCRILVFIFNVLFLLAGLALIIIGAIAETKLEKQASLIGNVNAVAIFLIVIGCIIFTISFFGCCGAWNKNYCMLITFSVFMAIMLVVVLAAVISAFVIRSKIEDWIRPALTDQVKNYNSTIPATTETWDELQNDLQCCGISNYTDWNNNDLFKQQHSVPDSCCISYSQNCGRFTNATVIHQNGCLGQVENTLKTNVLAVGAVAVVVALLMLLGIVISCCLAREIRAEYHAV